MTSSHDQVNYDPLPIYSSLRQTPAAIRANANVQAVYLGEDAAT